MKKLLTIGIPTYNGAENLLKFLPISHIDSNDVEYLIVDDGSNDNTLKVATEFSKKYKNIKVIHQKNKGFGGALNTIFKYSNSKYIYLLDCDDFIIIKTLVDDIKIMKSLDKENIDVFVNHFVFENKHNSKVKDDGIEKNIEPNKIITVNQIKKFKATSFFMNHNLIVKTELLRKYNLNLPNCHYCDNLYLSYIFMHAEKYYFVPEVLCHYQIGNESQSVSETSMAKNYEQHLMSLEALSKMIRKKDYKAMKTHHQRRVVLHYVFMTAFLALFSTYLIYNKERHNKYKEYIKRIDKENPYLYKKMMACSLFKFSYLIPRPLVGKFLVKGKKKFVKDIAWDY